MTMALVWWIGGGILAACASVWGLYCTAIEGYQDKTGFHFAAPSPETAHSRDSMIEPFAPRAAA